MFSILQLSQAHIWFRYEVMGAMVGDVCERKNEIIAYKVPSGGKIKLPRYIIL